MNYSFLFICCSCLGEKELQPIFGDLEAQITDGAVYLLAPPASSHLFYGNRYFLDFYFLLFYILVLKN